MPEQQFYTVKLLDKKMIARDILELRFERPEGFDFLAGQFVGFQVPTPEEEVRRFYSISSTPAEAYLEFCAKILPDGKASAFFSGLEINQTVTISPAQGEFICRPEHRPKKYFVATGAGLAPIISMIEDQLFSTRFTPPLRGASRGGCETVVRAIGSTTSHPPTPLPPLRRAGKGGVMDSTSEINLLFGVRTPEDIFWTSRLEKLQKQFSHFSYHLTVSRPGDTWSGLSGRVTSHLASYELLAMNYELSTEFYICGSAPMVKDVRSLLVAKGLDARGIHFEIF